MIKLTLAMFLIASSAHAAFSDNQESKSRATHKESYHLSPQDCQNHETLLAKVHSLKTQIETIKSRIKRLESLENCESDTLEEEVNLLLKKLRIERLECQTLLEKIKTFNN
ncbi:MAG: TolA-binding protein [Alteromonas naphthalenivorans]|jgi:TolA-binding protein